MAEKILGVGFHKTGTTSLGHALKMLGYACQGWNDEMSMHFHEDCIDILLERTDACDAFEDFPWPLIFKDFHQRHPEVKFILTKRASMDVWFDSLVRHCDRSPPKKTDFRRHLYGVEHPREDPDHVRAVHQKHMDDVRAYACVHGIPLLEVCFETGDGWDPLCDFLGKQVPDKRFPVSNQDPARSKRERLTRGVRKVQRLVRNLGAKMRSSASRFWKA